MKLNRALRKLRHRRGNVIIHAVWNFQWINSLKITKAIRSVSIISPDYEGWEGDWRIEKNRIVKREGSGVKYPAYFSTVSPAISRILPLGGPVVQ